MSYHVPNHSKRSFYVTQTALYVKPIGKKGNPCYSRNKENFLKNFRKAKQKNNNEKFIFREVDFDEKRI